MKKNVQKNRFSLFCITMILLISCFAVNSVRAQDTTIQWYLYVVPLDDDAKPLVLDSIYTGNDTLNNILDYFEVLKYTRSFPGAKTPLLDSVYEIHASGNIDSLKIALEGTGYFGRIEKVDYYIADCQNPHPPLNDPFVSDQYALEMIEARCAWRLTKGNPNVVVAVVDSEFDTDHEDLTGQIVSVWGGAPVSSHFEHGTAVTGCVAALPNNGTGVGSIGYNIKVAGYQVHNMQYNPTTSSFSANVWPAVWQAYREGRRVINVSYSGLGHNFGYPNLPSVTRMVVEEMTQNGVVLVFGAGNDNARKYHSVYANIPGVINVSGVGINNRHDDTYRESLVHSGQWIYHAHNEFVDLCAPSMAVYGIHPGDNYGNHWGTSFAAPIVAGTVGLMLSVNPCLSPGEIEAILKETADPIDDAGDFPGELGAGRLNAFRAVEMAMEHKCLEITKVGINTKCIPGVSDNSINPKFELVVDNGTPPYTYKWEPIMDGDPNGNNTMLNFDDIAEPTIVSSYGNHLAYYRLTVTDASGIPKRATHIVRVQLQTSGYDLAMRDSYVDLLDEPNMQKTLDPNNWNIWMSPDVWNQLDNSSIREHENPIHNTSSPNYVYVRVKNVGCTSSPSNVPLYLYWALASTGEAWPNDWVGNSPKINGNDVGGIISSTPLSIPPLFPGQEYVGYHEWYPTDPKAFDSRIHMLDVCLLARIVEDVSPPYGMTFPEGTSTTENVRNNNNIVTRNMNMYNLGREGSRLVVVSNTGLVERAFSFELVTEEVLRGGVSGRLTDFLEATIYLGEDLYETWQNGGGLGNFISSNSEQHSVKWNPSQPFRLDNIVLDTGVRYPIRIKFQAKYDTEIPDSIIGQLVHVRQLVLDTMGGYEVYGNVTFSIDFHPYDSAPPGVILVKQISNGPAGTRCENIELIVANCGSDQSDFVDVRGWVLDDNSGNFNNGGCIDSVGIMPGHYRLSDSDIWSRVPAGSSVILYNINDNCYNLPDSFTVTATNFPLAANYWVPVGYGGSDLVEKYAGLPGGADCNYCDSAQNNVYVTADAWGCTIGLFDIRDGFQTRCPGCNSINNGEPAFYHGIGYGKWGFSSIPIDTGINLGGPILVDSGRGNTFRFVGNLSWQLGDASYWTRISSPIGGTQPEYLGNDTSAIRIAAINRTLDLPCCSMPNAQMRKTLLEETTNSPIPNNQLMSKGLDEIRVYPNPAETVIYVEIPKNEDLTIIRLTDLSGRLILERQVFDVTHVEMDIQKYAPGIYIYHITTRDRIYSGKLTILTN